MKGLYRNYLRPYLSSFDSLNVEFVSKPIKYNKKLNDFLKKKLK